jgi:RND family efflux transporter MFP subunit
MKIENSIMINQHLRFLLFFLLFLSLFACRKEQQRPAPPPPKVTVARPVVQDFTNYVYFTGYTQARRSVDLRARVEGFLESFSFHPGDLVKKGDLLFTIDRKQFLANVDQAEADLASRQAELELARATLKRKESAFKQRAVSELAVLEARAETSKAEAQVKGAEGVLVNARLELSYTLMFAPVDGRMSRNLVDSGNLVGAGGDKTLLATLVNYDPIHVYFNVDERSLMLYKKTHKGSELESENDTQKTPVFLGLEGEEGFPHSGYMDYMSNEVDLSTGTIQVRGVFANEALFILPGMFARVRIPFQVLENALLVPEAALTADQRGKFLLTVNKENIVVYKPVKTGAALNGMRVISSGITADDLVIVKGIQRARPGSPVSPEEQAEPAKEEKGSTENRKEQPEPEPEKKEVTILFQQAAGWMRSA